MAYLIPAGRLGHAQTEPNGLHAGLAVVLTPEKTAQADDQAQHLVEARGLLGQRLLGQDVGRLPLLGLDLPSSAPRMATWLKWRQGACIFDNDINIGQYCTMTVTGLADAGVSTTRMSSTPGTETRFTDHTATLRAPASDPRTPPASERSPPYTPLPGAPDAPKIAAILGLGRIGCRACPALPAVVSIARLSVQRGGEWFDPTHRRGP
jgi:hypothetical protein